MANKLYEENDIQAIADAIRAKGHSGTMLVSEMAQAIADIPTGGGETYPDLSDAPIPEDCNYAMYVAIGLDSDAPKTASLTVGIASSPTTIEKGTLNNGIWTVLSSESKSGVFTLDWSDETGDYVIYRFYGGLIASGFKWFDVWHNVVTAKMYTNSDTYAGYFASKIFVPATLKAVYMDGKFSYGASSGTFAVPICAEIIDGSRCSSFGNFNRIFYGAFTNCAHLKTLIFPDTAFVMNYPNVTAWSGCTSLEELDLSMFDTSVVTNLSNAWNKCVKLQTLNISGWDLSAVTNISNTFTDCVKLQNLICDGAKLPAVAFSLASSLFLTDISLVGIANALPVLSTAKTLTLHAIPKARLATIMGTVADGAFTEDEEGDTTLLSFINNTKGWTVA